MSGRPTPVYERREPEKSILYGVVHQELETFLARARERDHPVPRFVERELRAYLECGILAHGFVRVHCDACGYDRLVAFSCKGRGFCPSCGARRMAETAAHLVDHVFPIVPVRQWVLSLPFALRYRLAYDSKLAGEVLRLFVRTVFASLRRRARRRYGIERAQCGGVTFVQRFGDALNLNLHFHTLVLDGVYKRGGDGAMYFRLLPAPDDAEVKRVARQLARRIAHLLERRGLGPNADPAQADPLPVDEPMLAALYAASVRGRVATGRRAGQSVLRLGDRIDADDLPVCESARCATVAGLSLHANVCTPARDRRRLERLCRYAARAPVATERLSRLPDGRILYRLRHRWRDGTTQIVFEPVELLERLAALIPPPRFHLVRYHGVLAPCASWRDRIVPIPLADPGRCDGHRRARCSQQQSQTAPHRGSRGGSARLASARRPTMLLALHDEGVPCGGRPLPHPLQDTATAGRIEKGRQSPRRLSWAELMRRVFAIDVLECPRCAASLRVLATIHPPEATAAILKCLALPVRAPPLTPARVDDTAQASSIAF